MKYIQIDSGSNLSGNSDCNACCCDIFSLSKGETDLIVLDYSAWSLPLSGEGIVPDMSFEVKVDSESCSVSTINGHVDPSNSNYTVTTATGTAVTVDLSANAAPAGNTFNYKADNLFGPTKGSASISGNVLTYTPQVGSTGYDYVSFTTQDAQGREVKNTVSIQIGVQTNGLDLSRMADRPYINAESIEYDQDLQRVSFPIHMPNSVQDCQKFRLTILQPARDCDCNLYRKSSCYDIKIADC